MPDQFRLVPYGDAVLVNTPTIDSVAKQLYVQQRERQLRQQQENQSLDKMLQKDFANIRSVDTPDVVESYGKYKQLKKNLLFNKELQRDPLAFNKAQQAANEAFSEMQSRINKSKEVKEMTKTMTTDRFKNPDAYSDDFGQRAATLMNTPLSSLQAHPQYGDMTNWDEYRYQGSNTNFNEIVGKVYDKKNKIIGKEEPLDKQGIQFRAPVYEYGTPPAQVYEGLINSLDHKTERDASYKWKQLTPDVVHDIEKKYEAIPPSKWEQMGLSGPQKIDLRGGSDAEKYMRLLAMQNAVNTNPRLVNYENRTSDKAKMDLQYERQLRLQAIKNANAKELIKYKKDIDPSDTDLNNTWIESYLQKGIDEAMADKRNLMKVYTPNTSKLAYELKGDVVLSKALTRGKIEPDRTYVTEDGKIWPIFFKYRNDKDGNAQVVKNAKGDPVIDEDYSKPMSIDQAKLALGYKGQTKKELSKTMTPGAKPDVGRKFTYNGKSYTRKELNDNGYDDNEINAAIKAGIIK